MQSECKTCYGWVFSKKLKFDKSVKIRESERRDMFLTKELWIIKLAMISIATGATETLTKELENGLQELETIG